MPLLDPEYFLRVMLVFVRISGVFAAAPFFSQRFFPVRVRVLLAVILAFSMAGLTRGPLPPHLDQLLGFAMAVMIEAVTGVVIGMSAQFIFWAINFAGEIMGFQVGLSLAQAYNPLDNDTANPISRFLSLAFMLVFLLVDGHHHILRGLAGSFEVIPLGGAQLQNAGDMFARMMSGLFYSALRLAAPFMVALLLIDLVLGVLARMSPQFDLFSLSMPLKLLLGLSLFYLVLQNIFPLVPGFSDGMARDMLQVMEVISP